MRSPPPAAAALLLAALTALPYRGTDADLTTTLLNADSKKKINYHTLNKTYQMLLTTYSDLINHTLSYSTTSYLNDFTNLNLVSNVPQLKNITYNALESITKSNLYSEKKHKRRKRYGTTALPSFANSSIALAILVSTPRSPTLAAATAASNERKRKGEGAAGAPLLNYIFDTYSSTHQHRNDRPADGNMIYAAAAPGVKALVGSTAQLDCKVDALHDKVVSWVRRKSGSDAMELLTTGTQKYTADDRYSARFVAPDTWRLEIQDVRTADAALYDCQLSAHPPRTARVSLHVPAVSVTIVDGAGASVLEQVCEMGSTVTLRCVVRGLRMEGGRALHWYRRDVLLNDDTTRGGISVRTELGASGAESVLRVARVGMADAGQYTCLVHDAPRSALLAPAHVALHVIQGESLAELHQGRGDSLDVPNYLLLLLFIYILNLNVYQ